MDTNVLQCPRCTDGIEWSTCQTCNGKGEVEDNGETLVGCVHCEGSGQVDCGPCWLCSGAATLRRGTCRAFEAWRRETAVWPRESFYDLTGDVGGPQTYTQRRHGSTDPALAMWWVLRRPFIEATAADAVEVKPVKLKIEIRPRLHEPAQTVPTQAVAVSLNPPYGPTLIMDGLSYGYGGTGPNGLAAVLDDINLETFADYDEALAWVASQRTSTWTSGPMRPRR